MSNKEIHDFTKKVEQGLLLAEKRMLQEKALHDQTVVVFTEEGTIEHIPAKDVIAANQRFQTEQQEHGK
jgi:hypothetical protein